MKRRMEISVMTFRPQASLGRSLFFWGASIVSLCLDQIWPLEVLQVLIPQVHIATLSQEAHNNFFFERQRLAPISAKQCIYYC